MSRLDDIIDFFDLGEAMEEAAGPFPDPEFVAEVSHFEWHCGGVPVLHSFALTASQAHAAVPSGKQTE